MQHVVRFIVVERNASLNRWFIVEPLSMQSSNPLISQTRGGVSPFVGKYPAPPPY